MGIVELLFIGIGLSMDTFAVSLGQGLAMGKFNYKKCLTINLFLGIAHASMILLGYVLARNFDDDICNYDHWIAFILLSGIGIKMLYESFAPRNKKDICQSHSQTDPLIHTSKEPTKKLSLRTVSVLAIATSIDALAVGITFALLPTINILFSAGLIGIITISFSFLGVLIGTLFGNRFEKNAERVGGIILIAIGMKILLEHLAILH